MRRLSLVLVFLLLAGCGRDIPTSAPVPVLHVWVEVTGKSMLPTFPEHCFVEAEVGVRYEDLQVGNSVIFWDYKRGTAALTHHRLIESQAGSWIVRGDNNSFVDSSWVTRDNFIARTTGRYVSKL